MAVTNRRRLMTNAKAAKPASKGIDRFDAADANFLGTPSWSFGTSTPTRKDAAYTKGVEQDTANGCVTS